MPAETLIVDPAGVLGPHLTIQDAVNAALVHAADPHGPWSRIRVVAATYAENVRCDHPALKPNLRFEPYDLAGPRPIVDVSVIAGSAFVLWTGCQIFRFRIVGPAVVVAGSRGVDGTAAHSVARIIDCEVDGFNRCVDRIGGGITWRGGVWASKLRRGAEYGFAAAGTGTDYVDAINNDIAGCFNGIVLHGNNSRILHNSAYGTGAALGRGFTSANPPAPAGIGRVANNVAQRFGVGFEDGTREGNDAWDCTTPFSGAGVDEHTRDPLFDDLAGLPAANLTWDAASPLRDSAGDETVAEDRLGVPRPQGAAFDRGCYEHAAVSILSVTTPDTRTIEVTLSGPVAGGSLLVPGSWAIEPTDGAADPSEAEAVAVDGTGTIITITTEDDMTPGGLYDLTPPNDVPSLPFAPLPFVVTAWGPEPPQEGILEATIGALTAQLANVYGAPRTQLRRTLAPGDTVAYVESCYGFPASGGGRFTVGDERESVYTSRTGRRLEGIVRSGEPAGLLSHPIKTPVVDASNTYSLSARVFSESNPATCPDDAVESLARTLGFPRPFAAMTTEDLRRYLTVRYYLNAGNWWAMFKVLRWAFRWASIEGVTGTVRRVAGPPDWTYLDVPDAELEWSPSLYDRWIYVDGRLCRIVTAYPAGWFAPNTTTLLLYSGDGSYHRGADALTDGATVAWELLAFRHQEGKIAPVGSPSTLHRTGYVRIDLFTPPGLLGGTFLLSAGLTSAALPPGRRPRGKLTAGAHVFPRVGPQGFYLSNRHARATKRTLVDVVAAGVEVEVKSLGQ